MYVLQHNRSNTQITCRSYDEALRLFYRQWRDLDGSIPWQIKWKE
jgi:hypothetical protein